MVVYLKKMFFLLISFSLILNLSGCNMMEENVIQNGLNDEFKAAQNAALAENELPESRIVDNIVSQLEFLNLSLTDAEKTSMTKALLKNFHAEVTSVSIDSANQTASATCTISNTDFSKLADLYKENVESLPQDELIANTWDSSEMKSTHLSATYLTLLDQADPENTLTSTSTIVLKQNKNNKWEPTLSGSLDAGLYRAISGNFTDSLESVKTVELEASYNALFDKLSGISLEEFVDGNYADHPFLAGLTTSFSDTSYISTETSNLLSVALLKNFSGVVESITFSSKDSNTSTLSCTFTNSDLSNCFEDFEVYLENSFDEIYNQIIDENLDETDIYDFLFRKLAIVIEDKASGKTVSNEATILLQLESEKWIIDASEIEKDGALFNAMFGNFLSEFISSSGNSYSDYNFYI